MKRFYFILTILLFCIKYTFSQVTIVMEKTGGVYKIPCIVNGAKMKFIFDTGAACVSLSPTIVEYMLDNGYLLESDFIGSGKTKMANGSTVNNSIINIRDFEIAGLHIRNVEAIVTSGQSVPLLLGQSVIQRLGTVSINGDKILILSAKNPTQSTLSEDEEYDIFLYNYKIEDAIKKQDTTALCQAKTDYYTYLWQKRTPLEDEYLELSYLYYQNHDIDNSHLWLTKITDKDELDDIEKYYFLNAEYFLAHYDYSKALFYYTKAQEETFETSLWRKYQISINICKEHL